MKNFIFNNHFQKPVLSPDQKNSKNFAKIFFPQNFDKIFSARKLFNNKISVYLFITIIY